MNDAKKAKSDGSIPPKLLRELGEHTIGGFIIFYFNGETGHPEHLLTFDSPAHSLALQKYISDWAEALHQVNIENTSEAIRQMTSEIQNEDEEEQGEQPV